MDQLVQVARSAVVGDGAGVAAGLEGFAGPPDQLATQLFRHQIADSVVEVMRAHEPASPAALALEEAVARVRWAPPVPPRDFLAAFCELRDALEPIGVQVLLLKGAVLSQRLYGGLGRRPQQDIDVLVPRAAARRARRALVGLGYRALRRDQHAAMLWRPPIEVDLHRTLRAAPAYAIDQEHVWAEAVSVEIEGVRARTLSDEHLLLLLSVSAVEDVGLGKGKLRQLCDLWLLARELDPTFDWTAWLGARRAERLEGLAATGLALALDVLDAREDAPWLAEALESMAPAPAAGARRELRSLLAASPGALPNAAWFYRLYPGSPIGYRLHSLVMGLPASLRDVHPARYLAGPALAGRGRARG